MLPPRATVTPLAVTPIAVAPSEQLQQEGPVAIVLKKPRWHCSRFTDALYSMFTSALAVWEALQTSHQGKYSIERLMAMDYYYRNTSTLRMIAVCLATPLPALFIAILIELLPLQRPEDGALANWAFWLRNWVTLFIMFLAMTTQVKVLIPELPFTTPRCLAISAIATSIYIVVVVLISYFTVFPLPFLPILAGVPGSIIGNATILLVLQIRPSTMEAGVRIQLKRFFQLCITCGILLLVYPAYSALFISVGTVYQSLLIIALRVFKLAMKNAAAYALSHLEDYLPEYVVFLVEVFNALYLMVCMQNASSTVTIVLIIGLDYVHSLWEMHGIQTRAVTMEHLIKECVQRNPRLSNADFLAYAIYVCSKPNQLDRTEAKDIHLRACLKHKVSPGNEKKLALLEAQNVFGAGGRERCMAMAASRTSSRSTVTPVGASKSRRTSTEIGNARSPASSSRRQSAFGIKSRRTSNAFGSVESPGGSFRRPSALGSLAGVTNVLAYIRVFRALAKDNNSTKLLNETLQSLFHIEYVVLVEYVECIVPFVYVVYSMVRELLPSNDYYPHPQSDGAVDPRSAQMAFLTSVLLYTGLEVVSFVVLNAMYFWKFRFLLLYQLAFVLENQFELVQSKLVMWIILLLQLELYHYDFELLEMVVKIKRSQLYALDHDLLQALGDALVQARQNIAAEHLDGAARESTTPLDGSRKASVVEPQPPTDASSAPDAASLSLVIASKRATIDNALHQLMATTPGNDVLVPVHDAVAMPSDVASRCLDVQATVVRTLLDRVEALWNDLELPALSVKRRRAVAAVVVAAFDFAVAFVAHPASCSVVSASEVLSILDRIGAAWTTFRDDKQSVGRLRAMQSDLTAFAEQAHANALFEWKLHQRLTRKKLQQFDNMCATLASWLKGGRCRGSALDRLIDEFERLLARSLLVWDVACESVVHTCVAHMAHLAAQVDDESIEKLAMRTAKLDAFRSVLSADVPQATLDARAENKALERARMLEVNASPGRNEPSGCIARGRVAESSCPA